MRFPIESQKYHEKLESQKKWHPSRTKKYHKYQFKKGIISRTGNHS